jgi:hypothetical protein
VNTCRRTRLFTAKSGSNIIGHVHNFYIQVLTAFSPT